VPIAGVMVDDAQKTEQDFPAEHKPKHEHPLAWVYERFLELPVPIVLAVLWLAGTVLIALCGLALYFFWLSLRTLVAG
jgi:hypothetical protein